MDNDRLLPRRTRPAWGDSQGFTLLETMVSMAILLVVMAGATSMMLQFTHTQALTWNRSDMHGSVRSATELLQQEVGQAGRITLGPRAPDGGSGVAITAAITPVVDANGNPQPQAATIGSTLSPAVASPTANMFVGERLVIDTGDNEETVQIVQILSGTSISAAFAIPHYLPVGGGGIPVDVRGGFATGVVSTHEVDTTGAAAGSNGETLKLYGDINGDGSMVYVEYHCDFTNRVLTRNMMPITTATKPTPTASQVLLANVVRNPPANAPMPCFVYEEKRVTGTWYVINVAITLTSESQTPDRIAGVQRETKALLNVAPRNVFEVWQLANMSMTNRVQPMPLDVRELLP